MTWSINMDNSGQNSQEGKDKQEYWYKLQKEKLEKYSPEVYRDYVLCEPIEPIDS